MRCVGPCQGHMSTLGASACARGIQSFVDCAYEGLIQGSSGQGVGLATKVTESKASGGKFERVVQDHQ